MERDRASTARLRDAGIEVLVLAPERIWLGPFSLSRGPDALARGREGALQILSADGESLPEADILR